MLNKTLLEKKLKESGYRLQFVASKLGLTYAGLQRKIKGITDFKLDESYVLAELLEMDDADILAVFFAKKS